MDDGASAHGGPKRLAATVPQPSCNVCGRRFFNKQTLERHMDTHRAVRRSYQCQLCHKTYACVTGLYHHRKTQHGSVARFQCHVCSEHFMYRRSLDKHIARFHMPAPHH